MGSAEAISGIAKAITTGIRFIIPQFPRISAEAISGIVKAITTGIRFITPNFHVFPSKLFQLELALFPPFSTYFHQSYFNWN